MVVFPTKIHNISMPSTVKVINLLAQQISLTKFNKSAFHAAYTLAQYF